MAKKFFYSCAGLFLLALAYHVGATTATAQGGSQVTGFAILKETYTGRAIFYALTANGDVYTYDPYTSSAGRVDNFWSGSPTPTATQSFGALKAKYR